ncbi:MAG: hypothetical protein L7S45_08140 [Luminiphilus sp.]|nr:hypothetical protein [Luminiphilus sp.]
MRFKRYVTTDDVFVSKSHHPSGWTSLDGQQGVGKCVATLLIQSNPLLAIKAE